MSEYAEYAKRLNAAFTTAAEKQKEAWQEYQAAEKAVKSAETSTEKIDADAQLKKAKEKLNDVQRHTWPEFELTQKKIGQELENAVRKSHTADPDQLDEHAVALLNSNMLTAADLESMVSKYSDNATMTRMVGAKAKEMADNAKDPADRAQLTAIAAHSKDENDPTIDAWNNLCGISGHYSGQASRQTDPETVCRLNEHWTDQNVQDVINNF